MKTYIALIAASILTLICMRPALAENRCRAEAISHNTTSDDCINDSGHELYETKDRVDDLARSETGPAPIYGEIVYEGSYTADVAKKNNAKGFRLNTNRGFKNILNDALGQVANRALSQAGKTHSEHYDGTITFIANFDGAAVTMTVSGTGKIEPIIISGLSHDGACRLSDAPNNTIIYEGRCDKDKFSGEMFSTTASKFNVSGRFDAGAHRNINLPKADSKFVSGNSNRCSESDSSDCAQLNDTSKTSQSAYKSSAEGNLRSVSGKSYNRQSEHIYESCPYYSGLIKNATLIQACKARVYFKYDEAAPLFGAACEEGNMTACYQLAHYYMLAGSTYYGLDEDKPRALALYKTVCDAGATFSCYDVARIYEIGDGNSIDSASAESYYIRACTMGSKKACAWMDSPNRARLTRAGQLPDFNEPVRTEIETFVDLELLSDGYSYVENSVKLVSYIPLAPNGFSNDRQKYGVTADAVQRWDNIRVSKSFFLEIRSGHVTCVLTTNWYDKSDECSRSFESREYAMREGDLELRRHLPDEQKIVAEKRASDHRAPLSDLNSEDNSCLTPMTETFTHNEDIPAADGDGNFRGDSTSVTKSKTRHFLKNVCSRTIIFNVV